MRLNRQGVIRNGSLTSQTDFESKFKISTQWLQSVPIQLIYLSVRALHSFKTKLFEVIFEEICIANHAFRVQLGINQDRKFSKTNQIA